MKDESLNSNMEQASGGDMNSVEEPTLGPGKIYDISDDLNISPAIDNPDEEIVVPEEKPIDSLPIPTTPFPSINSGKTTIPVMNIANPSPILKKSTEPKSIPLQDLELKIPENIPSQIEPDKAINPNIPKPVVPKSDILSYPNPNWSNKVEQTPIIETLKPSINATTIINDPTNTKKKIQENDSIKSLRTYESDIASVLAHKNISATKIAIAQQSKGEKEQKISNNPQPQPDIITTQDSPVRVPQSPNVTKAQDNSSYITSKPFNTKVFLVLLAIIFILIGIIGGYYLYMKSPIAPVKTPTTQVQTSSSLIPSDSQEIIDTTNLVTTSIVKSLERQINANQKAGTIKEIIPVIKRDEKTYKLTATEAIEKIDIDAPEIIVRSLTSEWMLGIYSDQNGEKDGFIVLTTNFFQNTFAGMLQWEKLMADDIRIFLYPSSVKGIANTDEMQKGVIALPSETLSSTTASSTVVVSSTTTEPVLQQNFTINGSFKDRIIQNKDVRSFVNTNGKTLFLYSFIDSSHLVITGRESTLNEIINRLEKKTFVR